MIDIIIIVKNNPGANAKEITYPNRIITKKIIDMRKKDFSLFLDIWSLKSIRSIL